MCGISGYFGNKNNRPSDQSILKTLEQMKNRGNDGVGSYSHNFNNKKVTQELEIYKTEKNKFVKF